MPLQKGRVCGGGGEGVEYLVSVLIYIFFLLTGVVKTNGCRERNGETNFMYYFVERVSSQAKKGSKQAVVDTTKKEKKREGGQTEVSYHNGCFGEMLT